MFDTNRYIIPLSLSTSESVEKLLMDRQGDVLLPLRIRDIEYYPGHLFQKQSERKG